MAATASKLKPLPVRRSAEREALAAAIRDRVVAERDLGSARKVVERVRQQVAEASSKLEAATAAVAAAKKTMATRLTSGAPAGQDLRTARATETQCADVLEATRAALAHAEAAIADPEYALGQTRKRVVAATRAVLTAETTDLLEMAKEAHAHFIKLRAMLHWLVQEEIIDDERQPQGPMRANDPMLRHNSATVKFLNASAYNGAADDHPSVLALRRALDDLARDADAPLPLPS